MNDHTARTFRPGSAVPLTAISAAIVLYLLGDAVLRSSVGEMLLLAPWPLLALWGVYVAAFASRVTVDERGVTVQNMLQIVRVPWRRVTDVRWHWHVELQLDDGSRIRAIGGPAQGRSRRRPGSAGQPPATARRQFDQIRGAWRDAARSGTSMDPEASGRPGARGAHEPGPDRPGPDRPGPDRPGPDRPGPDRPGPDRPGPDRPGPDRPGSDQPGPGQPDSGDSIVRRWDMPPIIALAALVVWAVVAVVVTGGPS